MEQSDDENDDTRSDLDFDLDANIRDENKAKRMAMKKENDPRNVKVVA